jgi:NAD(P)H-flavin reductase/hemoglobin-like flavoprotein
MSSFFLNEPSSDAAMTYFYGHLFAADPEIRAMFPATMAAQRHRFDDALRRIAAWTDTADPRLDDYLAALGRAHRKYGVRKEHYDTAKQALDATFQRFPPDAEWWREEDWAAAFGHAANAMITAAEQDAASAPAWWTAEIAAVEPRTADVAVLTLRPDQPFTHLAGQHVAVQTPRWPRVWRTYSIANAPGGEGDGVVEGDGDETLTLHVRAVPGGLVSPALRHAEPGDTLVLGPAEGTMIAGTESGRDVLCLAGGTGLAPLKAIATAIARAAQPGRRPEISLFFGARTEAGLYDLPALRAMELEYPWLRVHAATSDERAPEALHDTIPALVANADWKDRDVYISGPNAMIFAAVRRLRELGAPDERLHYDLPADITVLRRPSGRQPMDAVAVAKTPRASLPSGSCHVAVTYPCSGTLRTASGVRTRRTARSSWPAPSAAGRLTTVGSGVSVMFCDCGSAAP